MKSAVIIVGHGSRSGGWADSTLKGIAQEIKESGRFKIVEYGYLQSPLPRVEAALEECIRRGANK